LLLLLICALAWLGLRYLPLSRFSAALWILSGLIIIALRLNMWFLIQFFPNGITFPIWLRTPGLFGRIRHYFMDFGAIGYESSIYYLACGSILIGIAALIRYRKENLKD